MKTLSFRAILLTTALFVSASAWAQDQAKSDAAKSDGSAAQADVTLEKVADGFAITKVHLTLKAKIPGTDNAQFQELAAKAKAGCPVSKLLKADISLDASLV